MHTCSCVRMSSHVYTCSHVCTHAHTFRHAQVFMCACVHMCSVHCAKLLVCAFVFPCVHVCSRTLTCLCKTGSELCFHPVITMQDRDNPHAPPVLTETVTSRSLRINGKGITHRSPHGVGGSISLHLGWGGWGYRFIFSILLR